MLPASERNKKLDALPEEVKAELRYYWPFYARPEQLPPEENWRTWLYLAGRGAGKTRSGAEFVRYLVESGEARRVALVAPTAADVRDVMVEGESGILAISPPWNRPSYEPSKRRLSWKNGAVATTFSADEPERLRGPQFDFAWADEIAAWRYPEAWDMLRFALRLGDNPRAVVTTTPKPTPLIKSLVTDETVAVTRGTTFDNMANLSPIFFKEVLSTYEGTTLGRQEIYAEILEDVEGALWNIKMLDRLRVSELPELVKVVVGVDPPGGKTECGIAVAGVGEDGHGYVIEDRSLRGSPDKWGKEAVLAYNRHGANFIVGEQNYGGDMVENTIRIAARDLGITVPYQGVSATRGKRIRAEPVAALYEQGRVHHFGKFDALEGEMTTWTPEDEESPNRMDALVWALTKLMVGFVRAKGDIGIS